MPRRAAADVRRAAAALAVVALLVGTPPGRAAESFVSQLQTVAEIRFRGRWHVPARDLKRAMRTRSPSIWPWADPVPLRLDFLRADSTGIRTAYRERGYLDARVESVLVTPARDQTRPRVVITYVINEGKRSIIRAVDFTGNPHYPADQLRKKLFARIGRPFNPGFLTADTARISAAYQDRGYKPTVIAEAGRETRDSLRVRITYRVEEGRLYHFGSVYLSSPGELRVEERLIRRELLMKPGDVYRTSKVDQTLERLYETGLFSQVHITALPDSSNAAVEFDLRVSERRPRWIDLGLGSATSERFRFTGEWGHRNILGHGIQGTVGAQLALDGEGRFQRQRFDGSLAEPWLFKTRTRAIVTPYQEKGDDRAEEAWVRRYDAYGVSFALRRDLALRTRIFLIQDNTYVNQRFDFLSPPDSAVLARLGDTPSEYATHRLLFGYDGDQRDNPVTPLVGSLVAATGQIAGGPLGGGTYLFSKTQVLASWYRPLGSRGSVWGWRVGAGIIRPFGEPVGFTPDSGVDSDVNRVPNNDRFRLGGVNSIRGYTENEITLAGGLVMLLGNIEARVPLFGPFGLEAYVDAGNVWARPSDIKSANLLPRFSDLPRSPSDVRYVFGAGGRLNLPFGPLRVDFTWNLQPDFVNGRARWLVAEPQFAIGPSF